MIQSTEKENKMKELTFLLEESRDKVNQLEEKTSKNLYQNMEVCFVFLLIEIFGFFTKFLMVFF